MIISSFILFIGFLCSFSALLYHLLDIAQCKEEIGNDRVFHENWKIIFLWSCGGAILFLPMIVIGFFMPLLLFGTSLIWWFFTWGLLGLLLTKFSLPKFTEIECEYE